MLRLVNYAGLVPNESPTLKRVLSKARRLVLGARGRKRRVTRAGCHAHRFSNALHSLAEVSGPGSRSPCSLLLLASALGLVSLAPLFTGVRRRSLLAPCPERLLPGRPSEQTSCPSQVGGDVLRALVVGRQGTRCALLATVVIDRASALRLLDRGRLGLRGRRPRRRASLSLLALAIVSALFMVFRVRACWVRTKRAADCDDFSPLDSNPRPPRRS